MSGAAGIVVYPLSNGGPGCACKGNMPGGRRAHPPVPQDGQLVCQPIFFLKNVVYSGLTKIISQTGV
ncbi:hypothetical protein DCCM_0599 [Desulfocucumis palustris]|uniref:Uncharacterized protein n=1 Tax=Desulfocucumis palustris TaxID=1898651 RepID=A0A2L2X8A9_9FIRM|nr:hypothetical protein DCCM_0599 [Desulfocucumis palustris]